MLHSYVPSPVSVKYIEDSFRCTQMYWDITLGLTWSREIPKVDFSTFSLVTCLCMQQVVFYLIFMPVFLSWTIAYVWVPKKWLYSIFVEHHINHNMGKRWFMFSVYFSILHEENWFIDPNKHCNIQKTKKFCKPTIVKVHLWAACNAYDTYLSIGLLSNCWPL